jgi:hypothetical protein
MATTVVVSREAGELFLDGRDGGWVGPDQRRSWDDGLDGMQQHSQ